MIDHGFNFVPEVREIIEDPNMPQKGPGGREMIFSSSLPDVMQESAYRFLYDYLVVIVSEVYIEDNVHVDRAHCPETWPAYQPGWRANLSPDHFKG